MPAIAQLRAEDAAGDTEGEEKRHPDPKGQAPGVRPSLGVRVRVGHGYLSFFQGARATETAITGGHRP
jgi:hypothetical protein